MGTLQQLSTVVPYITYVFYISQTGVMDSAIMTFAYKIGL